MKHCLKIVIFFFVLATCWIVQGEAVVVVLDQPGVVFTHRQPIQVVVVDANGNNMEQTVYYDSSIGGIDLNASWAGPNASVYFPSFNTGYVWYNGYWVNPNGYYWNGGRYYSVGPNWNIYWSGYWRGHSHWNGCWHGGWHRGYHCGWHGGWHGGCHRR